MIHEQTHDQRTLNKKLDAMASKTKESPEVEDQKLAERSRRLCEWAQKVVDILATRRDLLKDLRQKLIDYGTNEKIFDPADIGYVDEELAQNASWIQTLEKSLREANETKAEVGTKSESIEKRRTEVLDEIENDTNVLTMHPILMGHFVKKQQTMKAMIRRSHATIVGKLSETVQTVNKEMQQRGVIQVAK